MAWKHKGSVHKAVKPKKPKAVKAHRAHKAAVSHKRAHAGAARKAGHVKHVTIKVGRVQ